LFEALDVNQQLISAREDGVASPIGINLHEGVTMESPRDDASDRESTLAKLDEEPFNSAAWEMIEPGRYQPRRIRGSCRGRALG
jgi:hypothetical protein